MKRKMYFILGSIFLLAQFCFSQVSNDELINKFVSNPSFTNASIGIYAIDTETKEVIMSFDPNRLLAPASTTKLFSTAYAIEELGGDYRLSTNIYYNGTLKEGILTGDIWIIGGGDMSLGSKFLNSAATKSAFLVEWSNHLLAKGIKQIDGTIYVDGSKFGYEGVPDDWLWGDIGNFYGTHFSGAMIYDNLIEYHFKTGAAGKKAELIYTIPQQDSLVFINNILSSTKTGDNSYMFGAPYSYIREGRGELPQNKADFMVKGSLPNPELQLALEFRKTLIQLGIKHNGTVKSTRDNQGSLPETTWVKIFEHKGNTIKEIATQTNFESINVFAEGLMRVAAFYKSGKGTHDQATSLMQSYWRQKLATQALYLNDGSGLARTNAINAKTMCDLLIYMKKSTVFYETLPVAGVSGTLRGVAKNQAAHGKVHAKSGTMRRTKSYAGYVEANSGRKIAFAFIVNNYTCSNKEVVEKMEILMNALVGK